MTALNCWEILKCGKTDECPAYPNRGRDCFNVSGTVCWGEKQGSYHDKIAECKQSCKYYETILKA
jgi:methyl-accepting chemotaxis protein